MRIHIDTYRIGHSYMSRNARTPAPRRRRIALSFGMAAGAALTAASFSLGTAPVAGADVLDADPASDLIGAADPAAVSAAGVSNTLALSYLIEAFDPHSFSSTGSPIDALGLLGYYTDTYLLGPTGLDAELAPLVQELVGTVTVGSPTPEQLAISDLIGALDPNAFSPTGTPVDALGLLAFGLDNYLLAPTGLDNLIYPLVEDIIKSLPSSAASVDVDPVSDLVLALDPSAFSAGVADLTAPTAAGLLDPVIDGLLNSGLSLF
jgi:hypothetical protein